MRSSVNDLVIAAALAAHESIRHAAPPQKPKAKRSRKPAAR
jgi:hypothetical protein